MSSDRRIESSRANGAKSHGPVTEEGKQRAAANSLKHGLTADTLVLSNEKRDEFDRILLGNEAEFTPQTESEIHLVRELSAAQWRQYRCWAIETSKFDMQMDIMEGEVAKKFARIYEPVRQALAFDAMAEKISFRTLIRYETSFSRQYHKALSTLQAIRRERNKREALPTQPPATPDSIPEQQLPNDPPAPEPTAEPTSPDLQNEPNPNFEHPENPPSNPSGPTNDPPAVDLDTPNPAKL